MLTVPVPLPVPVPPCPRAPVPFSGLVEFGLDFRGFSVCRVSLRVGNLSETNRSSSITLSRPIDEALAGGVDCCLERFMHSTLLGRHLPSGASFEQHRSVSRRHGSAVIQHPVLNTGRLDKHFEWFSEMPPCCQCELSVPRRFEVQSLPCCIMLVFPHYFLSTRDLDLSAALDSAAPLGSRFKERGIRHGLKRSLAADSALPCQNLGVHKGRLSQFELSASDMSIQTSSQ
jgi:hypothetical protein